MVKTVSCVLYVLQEESRINRREDSSLSYCIDDSPPWYLSIVLGFQVPQPTPVLMVYSIHLWNSI